MNMLVQSALNEAVAPKELSGASSPAPDMAKCFARLIHFASFIYFAAV
jgi:hypothetical protein